MNGNESKTASVETLSRIVNATKSELPHEDILAQAFHCSRAARRDERNGFTNTAAIEWRTAAELFAPNTRAVEFCWREWERIMHLPRRLAGPVGALAEGL